LRNFNNTWNGEEIMINEKRLVDEFMELVKIDSVSKHEGKLTKVLKAKLEQLGAKVFLDNAGKKIGSDGNNIIAKIEGTKSLPTTMLSAHMDTVVPGEGIKPIVKEGTIKSDGTTILGSDDKSGIAIILEILRVLKENKIKHPPLDVIFTVCEEVGLLGAKNLDFSKIDAKMGYVLDNREIDKLVNRAPSHTNFLIKVYGKASHAGASPEKGISAITIASKAIAKLTLGKIDDETTANIGIIKGGQATNIVTPLVEVKGEVRSHNEDKLEYEIKEILKTFWKTAREMKKIIDGKLVFPRTEEEITKEYSCYSLREDESVVKRALEAGQKLSLDMQTMKAGGGSDANIFNEKGITTAVLGTGMRKVHTNEECIKIDDLILGAKLLLEILTIK